MTNQLQDDIVAVLPKEAPCDKHETYDTCPIKKATKTLTELIAKRENRALIKGYDLGIQSWAEGKKRVKEVRKQLSSTTPKGKQGGLEKHNGN